MKTDKLGLLLFSTPSPSPSPGIITSWWFHIGNLAAYFR